ncbi:acyltransferase [Alteromonas sp. H39]|uniref:acyltransferase n=1 Tax=Alteromonas sp. H39 TaxID=3389876 RepID=UPI0039DFDFAC
MKQHVKALIHLLFIVAASPLLLAYALLSLMGGTAGTISAFSQFLSLFPGKSGSYLRTAFYRYTLAHCSQHAFIGFGTLFSQTDTHVQDGVYIGPQSNIGACSIGKNCLLGSGVHILSGKSQHNFSDLSTPIKDQGGSFTPVTIGEDCWIGNNAVIMADVGAQAVIAAGAVVVNPVPAKAIVGGNPAKVIKMRE